MKQRYVHNFLMVSAAFFAINAPVRVGAQAGAQNLMTGAPRMAHVRVEQTSENQAAKKKDEV